jgi:hypothetical protein
MRVKKAIGGIALLGLLAGCAPEVGGRASFPVLSRSPLPAYSERVATIDEKRCTHVVLFFVAWGDDANHEALISDILTEHKGDAITDAELTYFSIPALFYYQNCARVRGTVVRRAGGAAPTAPSGPPPVIPAAPPGGAP